MSIYCKMEFLSGISYFRHLLSQKFLLLISSKDSGSVSKAWTNMKLLILSVQKMRNKICDYLMKNQSYEVNAPGENLTKTPEVYFCKKHSA